MTKDPVCGMQVDEKNAPANSIYEGAFYAFCGGSCKEKFDEDPGHYAAAESAGAEREPQKTV